MRKIIGGLVLLLGLMASDLNATHLLGGEVTWQCTGNGQYKFQLTLYRECGSLPFPPAGLPASTSLSGPQGTIPVTRLTTRRRLGIFMVKLLPPWLRG